MTTGEIVTVEGTPMDFRTPTPVGARINDFDFVQLKNGNGYDHNWVLNAKGDITRKAALSNRPRQVSYSMYIPTNRVFRCMPATSSMVR